MSLRKSIIYRRASSRFSLRAVSSGSSRLKRGRSGWVQAGRSQHGRMVRKRLRRFTGADPPSRIVVSRSRRDFVTVSRACYAVRKRNPGARNRLDRASPHSFRVFLYVLKLLTVDLASRVDASIRNAPADAGLDFVRVFGPYRARAFDDPELSDRYFPLARNLFEASATAARLARPEQNGRSGAQHVPPDPVTARHSGRSCIETRNGGRREP